MVLELTIDELTLLSNILEYMDKHYILPDEYVFHLRRIISKVDNELSV